MSSGLEGQFTSSCLRLFLDGEEGEERDLDSLLTFSCTERLSNMVIIRAWLLGVSRDSLPDFIMSKTEIILFFCLAEVNNLQMVPDL